ncbi:serine hydrolase [Glaciecola sp. MH2013]|uniref:serine hydrolase n=1 Tax=Glaciecola sp. MH2013 TaxID=2785524 RepID=UPI00189DC89A|nr:serine hydrolase [Glaciecola sp. MH2013]MBF7074009.1 serine hydrolase [Glaciecola sp. MH2013]
MLHKVSTSRILTIIATLGICLMLASCQSLSQKAAIEQMPSKNYSYRVKSLIMHFTAVDFQQSVEALVNEGNVSSHYLIPALNDPTYHQKKIKIFQLVDETERAWHAGVSYWQGRSGLNDHSIGIEIVNQASCEEATVIDASDDSIAPRILGAEKDRDLCTFPDFEEAQIQALIELTKDILSRNPDITPTAIIGHSDVAPSRKNDPGPRFPWYRLYQEGIGAWYDKESFTRHWLEFNQQPPSLSLVQKALSSYGYGITVTGINNQETIDTLSAFQMHFLPWQVTGELNNQSAAAVFALLDKYFPLHYQNIYSLYQDELSAGQRARGNAIGDNDAITESLQEDNSQNHLALQSSSVNNVLEGLQGQINQSFYNQPDEAMDAKGQTNLLRNKAIFLAYEGQGELFLSSDSAISADVHINGEKIQLGTINNQDINRLPLGKRTRNGVNIFSIRNIKPQDASIHVRIPFPTVNALGKSQSSHKAIFDGVDSYIKQSILPVFPGINIAVVHEGKLIKHESYGVARRFDDNGALLANSEVLTQQHMFDLGETTQAFATNLAIMKLVSEGKIDLNKALHYYLPEFKGKHREAISVKDLLAHTSGFREAPDFYRADNDYGPYFYSQNPAKTKRLLLTAVAPSAPLGSAQTESEINLMLLGLLIERVSAAPLDDYLQSNIYQALGLQHTLFSPLKKGFEKSQFAATAPATQMPNGTTRYPNQREYTLQGEVENPNAFYAMGGVSGHSGLFSNTHDLAVLAQVLLNGGGYGNIEVFTPSTLQVFTSASARANTLGLGWQLYGNAERTAQFGPFASNASFGYASPNGTSVLIDPKHDLAIIILSNKHHSIRQLAPDNSGSDASLNEQTFFGELHGLIYEALLINNKK